MSQRLPTVSEALSQIKSSLESNFRNISVQGEVTNFSPSAAGHIYLTLSDGQSALSCALFRMDAMRNPVVKKLQNGDKVICHGGLGVYTKRGTFQLIIKRIEPVGKGDLKEQFEKLKTRLAGEGLFDLAIKKKIATLPKRIGLVTGKNSAAYFDFINVTKRRGLWMDVLLRPALVQGERSAESIRSALNDLIKYHLNAPEDKKLDVIVLSRGGGAMEDLWSFNDEGLAWDIFNSPIPIVSAVGHDVDYTICDYVSDLRCETPTAAAEFLCRGQVELSQRLEDSLRRLQESSKSMLFRHKQALSQNSVEKLGLGLQSMLMSKKNRLAKCNITHRLREYTGYHDKVLGLEDHFNRLTNFHTIIDKKKNTLEENYKLLAALNPHSILGRGYTFIKDSEGTVVSSAEQFNKVSNDEKLKIHFKDGLGNVQKA
jgi:exodeoxyribonuclease VII large subunit